MPFKSLAQEKYLYAKHPEVAAKFQADAGQPAELPLHKRRVEPEIKVKSPWLHMNTQKLEKGN